MREARSCQTGGKLISICISLFVCRRNDILPEAYTMAVASKICIASNDLEKLPVRGFIFSALRLQVTGYLGSLDEAFEVAIPREINAPICCLVFCEHQVSSHRTG
jgi:hypothetical protein